MRPVQQLAIVVCATATTAAAFVPAAYLREAQVLAPATYKPSRNWCPTNRTCFSHVVWTTYTGSKAVGYGSAKSCPGGGVGACHSYAYLAVELTSPRRTCHALRFTRLRMFGNTFRLSPVTCSVYQ